MHRALAPGGERPLTAGEVELATGVFGPAIDYGRVRIARRRAVFFQPSHRAMAPRGRICFHPRDAFYQDDFAAPGTPPVLRGLFIHEMTHVWQHQSGVWVWLRGAFERSYRYTLPGDGSAGFLDYGIEQQAAIVEDYFRLTQGSLAYMSSAPAPLTAYRELLPFRSC